MHLRWLSVQIGVCQITFTSIVWLKVFVAPRVCRLQWTHLCCGLDPVGQLAFHSRTPRLPSFIFVSHSSHSKTLKTALSTISTRTRLRDHLFAPCFTAKVCSPLFSVSGTNPSSAARLLASRISSDFVPQVHHHT